MKVLYNDGHVDECPADEVTHVIRPVSYTHLTLPTT